MRRGFLFSCRAQPQIAPYPGSGEGKMEITKDYWKENQDLDVVDFVVVVIGYVLSGEPGSK
jgi:hypothetical protein